jgi:hypothetical protein
LRIDGNLTASAHQPLLNRLGRLFQSRIFTGEMIVVTRAETT